VSNPFSLALTKKKNTILTSWIDRMDIEIIITNKNIIWQVVEYPRKKVVAEYFFEEDAHKLVNFQNKHKVWQAQGGIPSFLYINISK